MPNTYVSFVRDEDFIECVKWVCDGYNLLANIDIQENTVDPIKMIFDIINTKSTVQKWIEGETIRQADKSLNNRIGEFHQKLLGRVNGWRDLGTSHETACDLYNAQKKIYIELKNKYNTVNGDSLSKVRDKLEKVVATNTNATAYYAYIVSKRGNTGDIVWRYKKRVNPNIHKIWGKKVYSLVTGNEDALNETWLALPRAISTISKSNHILSADDQQILTKFFDSAFGQ